jgi:acetyltransferase-like isoleucine patch superfamily enzyme
LALLSSLFFIPLGWIAHTNKSFISVAIILSKVPLYFGEKLRYFFYKLSLAQLGDEVIFKYGSFCNYRKTLIGDRVLIGYYNSLGEVNIGDDVVLGGFVNILSGTEQHSFKDLSKPIATQPAKGRRMITIGSDVWIGSNSVICNDVGNRCVIGAGSVVVKKVEDQTLVAGNPARMIKKI